MSLPALDSISKATKTTKQVVRLLRNDLRARYGEQHPIKPRTLNFLANDTCNAECQMCNIWERPPGDALTPEEVSEILEDPLFEELSYVGVSGGEPTLRPDLPEFFEAIVKTRPEIGGTGIITNGLVEDVVIDRVEQAGNIARNAGVDFNIMVSLDGVGEVHDRVRGTEGAFESAVSVMRYFRDETDFKTVVGCTVTSDNVYGVSDLYEFCKSENVESTFRIAESIDRLYNDKERNQQYIRNFTQREAYHLGLFFAKLERETDSFAARRQTYRNIRKMLLEGENRSIGCYMQSTGATLDSRGELAYCAPKSPKLGDCLEESPTDLYRNNMDVREEIREEHCDDCIHDYPSPKTASELTYLPKRKYWNERLSLGPVLKETKATIRIPGIMGGERNSVGDSNSVLIMGWYGTETAGDKAILGQIIHEIQERNPDTDITLASLNPYLSKWSLQELGYPDVEIIETYSQEFVTNAKSADEVVMGGGPLMHIDTLGIVLKTFLTAKRSGNQTRIAGCGIGPLDKGGKYREAVKYILKLADEVELRNQGSIDAAEELVGKNNFENNGDPAFEYVKRWKANRDNPDQEPYLNLYLRDWPRDYGENLTDDEFLNLKSDFESELADWITGICEEQNLQPRLLPMHHFFIGNDDRAFARRFSSEHLNDRNLNPVVEQRPLTLDEILQSMQDGELSLCMRYHSVAFANELGEDFYAIDYSQGGKVARYLTERNKNDRMLNITEIAEGRWDKLVGQKPPQRY